MWRSVGGLRGCSLAATAVLLASGCSVHNIPVNEPVNVANAGLNRQQEEPAASYADEFLILLSFSGGGTRAAAYSFGVLRGLDRFQLPTSEGPQPLLDRVDFVSGVSGGSITAAYFGLKKRAALADFRERFLLKNVESDALSTSFTPGNLVRGLSGGVNDATHLPRWLSQNLFDGATFAAYRAHQRPRVIINAADIFNRTPFVFGRTAFSVMCSDLASYPIADAVAASAAVPIAFAPIVIESYAGKCGAQLPDWAVRARTNPNAPPLLKSFANALASYHTGNVRYVKLLDGGLVDNYGLSGFTIARLSADKPFEPLTPQQAVKLRRDTLSCRRCRPWRGRQLGEYARRSARADLVAAPPIPRSTPACGRATPHSSRPWRNGGSRWCAGAAGSRRRSASSLARGAMELPRPAILYRQARFRPARRGARGLSQQGQDQPAVAGRPGRRSDRRGDEIVTNNDVVRRFLGSMQR